MSTCDRPAIDQAPPGRRADALRLVFRHLDNAAWSDLCRKLRLDGLESPSPLPGLLEARRRERTVGAVWTQLQPGATAVVLPPGLVDGEPRQTANLLMAAVVEFLQSHPVTMAQALLDEDSRTAVPAFEAAGFSHAADLLYMDSHLASFPAAPPECPLEFEPSTEQNHARLAGVVEQTYAQTCDCPRLGNRRNIEDVLRGYRAAGVFDPAHWQIVRNGDGDVGCLLLNDHPEPGHLELVYMGIVPEARGNGWGMQITQQAQWITRHAGRKRLVLAVDAANEPALDMYARCGFVSWDRRNVFLRFFSDERDRR